MTKFSKKKPFHTVGVKNSCCMIRFVLTDLHFCVLHKNRETGEVFGKANSN